MEVCDKMKSGKKLFIVLLFLLSLQFIYVIAINSTQTSEYGIYEFNDTEADFGNLIGNEIENEDVSGKDVVLNKTFGSNTITFTKEGSYFNISGDLFENVKFQTPLTNSFVKLNEKGEITEADLTASDDTSFVFNNTKIDIKKGTQVIYQNGVMNVFGNSGEKINLLDKVEQDGKVSFTNKHEITFGDEKGRRVFIEGNKIRSDNFKVDDLAVKGINPDFRLGEVTLVPEGYLLGGITTGEFKGMSLSTLDEVNLLLTESGENLDNYQNYILFGDKKLKAQGEFFDVNFGKDNPYVKIEDTDNFKVRAMKDFSLELENRDSIEKIPQMIVGGDFIMDQDNKGIYTEDGEILIDKESANLYYEGSDLEQTSTSPVELLIKDTNSKTGFRDESYIISNFNGITSVPFGEQEGFTDERYANSIHFKRASTDIRYNYPTIEGFERITGKKVEFLGKEFDEPEDIRRLIDIYYQNPNQPFSGITKIKVYDEDELLKTGVVEGPGAFYNSDDKSINIPSTKLYRDEAKAYGMIIHEAGHAIHYDEVKYKELEDIKEQIDLVSSQIESTDATPILLDELNDLQRQKDKLEGEVLPIDFEWKETLEKDYSNLDFVRRGKKDYLGDLGTAYDWNTDNQEYKEYERWVKEKVEGVSDFEPIPYSGFVEFYGTTNIKEDIATFREAVVSNPGFFKRFRLLDSENNPYYFSAYKKKIDLLLKYGFITQAEYGAVFE